MSGYPPYPRHTEAWQTYRLSSRAICRGYYYYLQEAYLDNYYDYLYNYCHPGPEDNMYHSGRQGQRYFLHTTDSFLN